MPISMEMAWSERAVAESRDVVAGAANLRFALVKKSMLTLLSTSGF
jgi:hypothetical protein